MARTGQVLRTVWHYGKKVAPFLISVGLVTWLVWTITPDKLLAALSTSGWPWLLLATLGQLVVLFIWDTLNLWWLFSQPHPEHRPPFRLVLRARTDSILWSAINLEIGQAVFAVKLAKLIDEPVTRALGRFLVLALFDFGTLQSLGLVCSFLVADPFITHFLRWVCLAFTLGMVVLAVLLYFLPAGWRRWAEDRNWGQWLKWWGWRHSLLLWAQRLTMFLLVILYAWIGLDIIGINPDARTVFGKVPFVIIAESLPGTGGLGERETALVYLLNPGGKEAELLAFGLIWSVVIVFGRLLIGLVSTYLVPRAEEPAEESQGTPAPRAGSDTAAA